MATELVAQPESPEYAGKLSPQVVLDRLGAIQELMRKAMRPDVDYGQIPGTQSKPTLLKPGAEKLCVMFRFCPEYRTSKHFDGGHLTVECSCRILDAQGGFLGEANAIASTKESKYAYRNAGRTCPECGKAAIIQGKKEYGGGWICFKKKDGCGAKFGDTDPAITSQAVGRVDNPDIADQYNTVLRIAEKRAFIAAVRLVTGSSALFDEEFGPIERDHDETAKPQLPKLTEVELSDWRDHIRCLKTPEDLGCEARKVEEAPEGSRIELRKLVLAQAKAQGLVYDRTISMFIKAEAKAVTTSQPGDEIPF